MSDRGGELTFLQDIHVKIGIRIVISISVRSLATKFGKQVHLQDLAQMRLIKQVLVTPSHQYHFPN